MWLEGGGRGEQWQRQKLNAEADAKNEPATSHKWVIADDIAGPCAAKSKGKREGRGV